LKCIFCPAEAPDDAAFCPACGGRLGWRCTRCNERNATPFLRCRRCGAENPHRTQSPELLRSERKLLTVLFADIRGSLELIRGHDPEQASAMLEGSIELMIQAVQTFDGTVSRVMGDGIMALFGAPRATEHHALRACLSALRIRETAMQSATQRGSTAHPAITLRVGLASGEVVVKPMVANNFAGYDADGEVVHLAARMEQSAPENSILITPQTARLVMRNFELRPVGPTNVKGLAEQMELYELVAVLPRRRQQLASHDRPTAAPIGRDREFAAIANAREQAAAGEGRIISISGDAGFGKSRLIHEALRREPGDWLILEGQALPYGSKGYRIVLDMLAGLFSLEAGDDTATAIGKIRSVLRLHAMDELLTPLAAMHELDAADADWQALSSSERGRRIQTAVMFLFETIAASQPLAVIAEDLHWIDPESQDVLAHLAPLVAGSRILLVTTFRPEFTPAWSDAAHHVEIRLDPLSEAEARQLLGRYLVRGPGVAALEEVLIARAGGNPLFLQEMVSSLAEEGVLSRAEAGYRLARTMEPDRLPESVRSLLAERIDRLPAQDKDVLQSASVIGQSGTVRLLARVADMSESSAAAICARLQEAGFVESSDVPEPSYTFRHALMCDAAYAGLLHQRRGAMHARVVTAMEEFYADRIAEHVEELAGHAARARDWRKAADYARRAGAKTAARDASAEAVRFYEWALDHLEHCEDGPDRRDAAIDLHLAIRDPLFRLGRLSDIDGHLRRAEMLLRPQGDTSRLGYLHVLDSHVLSLRGEVAASIEAYESALRIAEQIGDHALEARALFLKGFVLFSRGDFVGADAPLRAVRAHFAAHPGETRYGLNRGIDVASLSYAARARARIGDVAQAESDIEQMLALAEHHASPFEWSFACIAAGQVNDMAGKPEQAMAWLERALTWCEQANAPLLTVTASGLLGLIEARSGKLTAGLARLRHSLAQIEEMGFRNHLPFCLAALAEATLAAGDHDAAQVLAERAYGARVTIGDNTATVLALLVLGACCAHHGRAAMARSRVRSALTLAESTSMEPLARQCRAALAELTGQARRKTAARPRRRERIRIPVPVGPGDSGGV
jgi:class 3 adenylate cyclase/tetratricopeptide (TPR) repeat protein